MTLDEYQELAEATAVFPDNLGIIYCTVALNEEAGEVAGKVKKVIRDNDGVFSADKCREIAFEVGDLLWYAANLAAKLGYTFEEVAQMNLDKLKSRQERGVIQGSGDNR